MLEVNDKDYRDSETLWLLVSSVPDGGYQVIDVIELTRADVEEMLSGFDQDES